MPFMWSTTPKSGALYSDGDRSQNIIALQNAEITAFWTDANDTEDPMPALNNWTCLLLDNNTVQITFDPSGS